MPGPAPGSGRDPISVLFDGAARRLLERAYSAPRGTWVTTRVVRPDLRQYTYASQLGINLEGPDISKRAVGTRRNRWDAAFERAVHYQHKWYGGTGELRKTRRTAPNSRALDIEWGRMLPGGRQAGTLYKRGRAVRVRMRPGGQVARRAVQRLPESKRIFADDGTPAGKWHSNGDQDW